MIEAPQPWALLSPSDRALAKSILGIPEHWAFAELPVPDLTIAPDGNPYLHRWHVIPRNPNTNVYLHVQVDDDPERPLHDHPWNNFSVILSGGYDEILCLSEGEPQPGSTNTFHRRTGDTVYRTAAQAHRLLLPRLTPYTMTLFSTGPKIRDWGFWYPDGWRPYQDVTELRGNTSVHIGEKL